MTDAIVDLALRTAAVRAVGLDLGRHLTDTCVALVDALGVAASAVVVLHPAGVYGSDDAAVLIGEAQRGAPVGPVANALRSGRPMLTPDLLRVGPPVLTAAAADCGLVSCGVVPLYALNAPVAALVLLGDQGRPIEAGHLDRLAPLADVLGTQLANVAAIVPAGRAVGRAGPTAPHAGSSCPSSRAQARYVATGHDPTGHSSRTARAGPRPPQGGVVAS